VPFSSLHSTVVALAVRHALRQIYPGAENWAQSHCTKRPQLSGPVPADHVDAPNHLRTFFIFFIFWGPQEPSDPSICRRRTSNLVSREFLIHNHDRSCCFGTVCLKNSQWAMCSASPALASTCWARRHFQLLAALKRTLPITGQAPCGCDCPEKTSKHHRY